MSLSKAFKTDKNLERKGVDIEVAQNEDGSWATFRLCRAGRMNPDYQAVSDRIMKPFRRAQQVGALPDEKLEALTRQTFAEAGVVHWANIPKGDVTGNEADSYEVDAAGNPVMIEVTIGDATKTIKKPVYVEYSVKNAIALFENLPQLYLNLVGIAAENTTWQQASLEDDAKNSVKS